MAKRVVIVHRWSGSPTEDWYPWLKAQLEKAGCEVIVPEMPDPDEPIIDDWVDALAVAVGGVDRNTYFVGHSVGAQTVMRYLEDVSDEVVAGGMVTVAGWISMNEDVLEEDGSLDIARPWLHTPIDFGKVRRSVGKIVSIFSSNDPYVPVSNAEMFKNQLGAETVILPNLGHITSADDVTELQAVLDAVNEVIGSG